jgi:ribosomal protein S18 acetylase RimI-like enzyme
MTTNDGLVVREATPGDRPAIDAFLHEHNADVVARRGELVDARRHRALIALDGERLAGVVTFVPGDAECEALTVHAAERGRGAGTALLESLCLLAAAEGWRRVWLITTNDNLDALRFYQRRGFRLVRVHPGAVDDSRARFKPGIPATGMYGIPLRDELELERVVTPAEVRPSRR